MDERTHDTFATTGVDLVTLTDDAEVLADVAETAHTLYNEKQPEGQNLPAHVLQSQFSLYEDEDANFANKDKLDLLEDIGEYGESKEKPLVVEVPDNHATVSLEQHDMPRDFNMLIEYSPGSASGVPTNFITLRNETVKQFSTCYFLKTDLITGCC
ncbi:hypothetical protein PI124_g11101 [Phytophthora idaei]|nr:hypothetical protein PI125_g10488 [Phytophthora idaei]KAG3140987.1 hypothetical protein PI126_g15709 [Phytophthora idaei]KAG3244105.1 hypothetical protein PI124_g11101 [Phytophthora idaei]